MTDWACARCRAQVAPGAPRCPECPSTEFIKAEAEADMVLKIARDGGVSDSADVRAAEAGQAEQVADIEERLEAEPFHIDNGGITGASGLEVLKAPAAGAAAEAAPEPAPAPSPAAPPRVPPRRTAPPAVPRE